MNKYQYIVAPVVGWLVAQAIKFAISLRKDGIRWGDLVQSGGMPSSHSAFMMALTTVIGLSLGISNVAFGISASLTAIIVYDAMGVRRTTGQQTVAILELAKSTKHQLKTEITIARGHTPIEAFMGCLVGIIVGFAIYSVW
jgi:acid phosphatase family membrane protein YuiD